MDPSSDYLPSPALTTVSSSNSADQKCLQSLPPTSQPKKGCSSSCEDGNPSAHSPLFYAAAAAKSRQSCPTLCAPIYGSPPGSSIPGILQARTLEWVAISFSSVWQWKVKVKSLSRVWLLVTWWTVAHQAPPSMGFPTQEYWSGLPLPSPPCSMTCSKNSMFILHI